ncbi:MAG: hypothetical protein ACYSUK_00030 [Planctomycetota bacterium]|jgi:hypothetical protein
MSKYLQGWDRLLYELKQVALEDEALYGGITPLDLARYLNGELSVEKHKEVEFSLNRHPRLQKCLDTVAEVIRDG